MTKWYFFMLALTSMSGCMRSLAAPPKENDSPKKFEISSREEISLGKKISFHSPTLQETRSYWIHLPKSYNDDTIFPKKSGVVCPRWRITL
jgi:hypothetical protein